MFINLSNFQCLEHLTKKTLSYLILLSNTKHLINLQMLHVTFKQKTSLKPHSTSLIHQKTISFCSYNHVNLISYPLDN